jgi:hypothetical protein
MPFLVVSVAFQKKGYAAIVCFLILLGKITRGQFTSFTMVAYTFAA